MEQEIRDAIITAIKKEEKITFLIGAGLSAESGIPTFRGFDGYWTVGSDNYTPEEMGTYELFSQNPYAVWNWYLYRAGICNAANPNPGHFALGKFEQLLGDQFALVSQNVDGLHFRAGSSEFQTYLIHGDLRYMRCAKECSSSLFPLPASLPHQEKDKELSEDEKALLTCPHCGGLTRPHVLWFDESYDEQNYRVDTVVDIAENTGVLIVIGTSGATTLPRAVFDICYHDYRTIVNIDPNANTFSRFLQGYKPGFAVKEGSGTFLPKLYAEVEYTMQEEEVYNL